MTKLIWVMLIESTTRRVWHARRYVALKLMLSFCISTCPVQFTIAQTKTVELKPIQKQGWLYFYDFRRVSTAEALQIPLQAMNDKQINQHYHSFKILQGVGGIVSLVPAAYVLSVLTGQVIDTRTFWYLVGGSLATNLVFQVWSHHRMALAINRYNYLLLPSPTGHKDSPRLPGLALTIKL